MGSFRNKMKLPLDLEFLSQWRAASIGAKGLCSTRWFMAIMVIITELSNGSNGVLFMSNKNGQEFWKSYHQNNLLEARKLAQWIKCSLFKSSGPGFRLLEPTEELGGAVYVCNPSTRLSKQILEASWPPSLDKMVSPMFREKPCLKGYGREWLSKVSSVNLCPPHAPELVSKWAHMDMWWRIQYTKEDLPVSK